ncbi:MAG: hypothetical protein JKY09_08770 [Crocinitomicaceae bacterium]|nr:hypothetical protein [Crocinitomicaceae bacterium]
MAGLKFRVLLDSKDKNEVFRDIIISDNDNFESFYKAILSAYHFSEEQMASFYMSNENWDKGHEISLFDMSFGEDPDQILPGVMRTSMIQNFIQEADQKMILVHDFLRMWIFLIELIGYEDETPETPKVVLSVGNAPAEDSKSNEDDSLRFESEENEDEDEDEDEFGFGDYEDQYDY